MKTKKLLFIPIMLLALVLFSAFTIPQAHAASSSIHLAGTAHTTSVPTTFHGKHHVTVTSEREGVSPQISSGNCGGRSDFFTLFSTTGYEYCFANAGTLSPVYYPNIYEVCSGNNNGTFNGVYIPYWTCYWYNYSFTVHQITIY